jgi:hypothetical protein
MSGGEISGNTAYSRDDYHYDGGGGVYVASDGIFTKAGGTITGYSNDTQNGNVVKNNSGVVQINRGHAVFAGSELKRKETTVGPGVALDSTKSGVAGGWDDITFTPLTENTWADGSIATSYDVQWFKFTATADPQYIYFSSSTLNEVLIQVYDSSGTTVGDEYYNNIFSVTVGQEYYIMVRRPYYLSGGGTYKIAFNAVPFSPDVLPLTENIWADGSIATSYDFQQFKFTATASSTQYIHFSPGTLTKVRIYVYDSSGVTVGSTTVGVEYNYFLDISRSVRVGQEYYITVRPVYFDSVGTYKIAFNASSTAPSL